MKTIDTTAALLLLAAVAGCGEGGSSTIADSDNLGKEIVEALAKARGGKPDIQVTPAGFRVPVDLSRTVMGIDSWNEIGDPDLAKAVGEYAKGAYPGGLIDCSMVKHSPSTWGARCFPLSPDNLPTDGLLMFWGARPSGDAVSVVHYDFVSVEDEMAVRLARGVDEGEIKRLSADHPDGWLLDRTIYSVDVERLEDGGWRVGKARYACCV